MYTPYMFIKKIRLITKLLIVLTPLFYSTESIAGLFDSLVMPGPVIHGHAEFEQKCESCHETLSRDKQNKKCVSCHDHSDILKDINEETGYHGRDKRIRNSDCNHCHSDHKGRDAKIILFNTTAFDHQITDFQLKGGHKTVTCISCHQTDKKYSEAPMKCIDCHKSDDPHKEKLGDKCETCHNEDNWNSVEYNHGEATKFALEGKHTELTCGLCHVDEQYKKTPKSCISCHQLNDTHRGKNGEKCNDCHGSESWDEIIFNHDVDTKFRLNGAHKKTKCIECHKSKLYGDKLEKSCFSCHRNDDKHKGIHGRKCDSCHNESKWTGLDYRHDKTTDFPLTGKHEKLTCESCHRKSGQNEADRKLEKACISCHQDDDPHEGQQGEVCDSCHKTSGWGGDVIFQHDITRFPLIGQHSVLACEVCHLTPAFKDTERSCAKCHDADDIHKQSLGGACEKCHTPNDWSSWIFDHDTETDYTLTGKHHGLECGACHLNPVNSEISIDRRCINCHLRDDKHRGQFGRHCKRCHTTETFSEIVNIQR